MAESKANALVDSAVMTKMAHDQHTCFAPGLDPNSSLDLRAGFAWLPSPAALAGLDAVAVPHLNHNTSPVLSAYRRKNKNLGTARKSVVGRCGGLLRVNQRA